MNWNDPQSNSLDELLQRAQWPEPTDDQLARLQRGWRRTVRNRKLKQVSLVSAAVLLPTIAALAVLINRGERKQAVGDINQQIAEHRIERQNPPQRDLDSESHSSEPDQPTSIAESNSTPETNEPQPPLVREPTLTEQAIALVYRHDNGLDGSIASKAVAKAAEPLASDVADQANVDELFAEMSNPRMSVRLTAARALGSRNDPEISSRLVKMAIGNLNRREALVALLSSSDLVARQFLAYAQENVELAASVRALSAKYAMQ